VTARRSHTWTAADEALLRQHYGKLPTVELADLIGVSRQTIRHRAAKLGLRWPAVWTDDRTASLGAMYPEHTAAEIAAKLGLSENQVRLKAAELGLKKTKEWFSERQKKIWHDNPGHGARRTQFAAGHATWNKGKSFVAGGRSAETRFKAGRKPHTWHPIGATRVTKDGTIERKISDTRVTRHDFVPVHHLIWRMHGRGSIPAGHVLSFVDGNKANVDINNLAIISRAELMQRNSLHRHPPEVTAVYQAIGAITRQINRRLKNEHRL
jgi:hypothetical protein